MKNKIFDFITPQASLEIIKKIPESASELESLLKPINEPLAVVRDKIDRGQETHIPYLQKILDEQSKDVNFQKEYDKFIAEMRPSDQQSRALSMSLIMVASLEIKSVTMIASEIFQKHDPQSGWTIQRIREMGPDYNGTKWAEGIYAASNYVRHSDEWRLLPLTEKDGVRLKMDPFERLKQELPAKDHNAAISNLKIIQKLGIGPEKIVFDHHEVSFRLVERLDLNKPEIVVRNFKEWGDQIFKRAQKIIK